MELLTTLHTISYASIAKFRRFDLLASVLLGVRLQDTEKAAAGQKRDVDEPAMPHERLTGSPRTARAPLTPQGVGIKKRRCVVVSRTRNVRVAPHNCLLGRNYFLPPLSALYSERFGGGGGPTRPPPLPHPSTISYGCGRPALSCGATPAGRARPSPDTCCGAFLSGVRAISSNSPRVSISQ